MAVSRQYEVYGLLNRWAQRMNVPIYLFNQCTGGADGASPSTPGARVYVQPERENIAEGIVTAVALMREKLRFYPRPVWLSETITLPAEDWLDRRQVLTRWAHVDAIGKRGLTVLADGVPPLYSDSDGDGINDLATLTVPDVPADTDTSQVRLYFSTNETDAVETGDPRWEIEPLTSVSLSGTTLTITAHRALFVKPEIWAVPYSGTNYNKSAVNAADVTDSDHFTDQVDVCVESPDTDGAALLRCNPYPEAPNTSPTAWDTFAADAVIEDGKLGIVNVRPQPDVTLTGVPTSLTLYYRAGYPLDDWGRMDPALATAILRLANCHMPMRPGLDSASTELWLNDVAEDETEHGGKLGVLRGQVAAWRLCKMMRILPSPRAV